MDINQCACSGTSLDRFLRPSVLAALKDGKSHGYDIVRTLAGLAMFRDAPPDASGVYKTLKIMETEGLLASALDSDSGGPAKRCYALTPQGRQCLRQWADTLRDYREQIDRLLSMLTTTAGTRKKKAVHES